MKLVEYKGNIQEFVIQRMFYGFTLGCLTGPFGLINDSPEDYWVTYEEEEQDEES